MSRYESAFLKMARVAGSNEPEQICQKFINRNEMRAQLLAEREEEFAFVDAEFEPLVRKPRCLF